MQWKWGGQHKNGVERVHMEDGARRQRLNVSGFWLVLSDLGGRGFCGEKHWTRWVKKLRGGKVAFLKGKPGSCLCERLDLCGWRHFQGATPRRSHESMFRWNRRYASKLCFRGGEGKGPPWGCVNGGGRGCASERMDVEMKNQQNAQGIKKDRQKRNIKFQAQKNKGRGSPAHKKARSKTHQPWYDETNKTRVPKNTRKTWKEQKYRLKQKTGFEKISWLMHREKGRKQNTTKNHTSPPATKPHDYHHCSLATRTTQHAKTTPPTKSQHKPPTTNKLRTPTLKLATHAAYENTNPIHRPLHNSSQRQPPHPTPRRADQWTKPQEILKRRVRPWKRKKKTNTTNILDIQPESGKDDRLILKKLKGQKTIFTSHEKQNKDKKKKNSRTQKEKKGQPNRLRRQKIILDWNE